MPSADPGNVMPRINRINKTAYGNNAVNHTTCSKATEKEFGLTIRNKWRTVHSHLSRCTDAFPQRKVTNQINGQQTQRHIPFYGTQIVNTFAMVQF